MKQVRFIIIFYFLAWTLKAQALEIPKPITNWINATIQHKNSEMQIKTTTFPGVNSTLKAVVSNMHVFKSDSLLKITSDTLDIIQSYNTQLSINKSAKEITIHTMTDEDKEITRLLSNIASISKMLNMYDTVYVSGNTNNDIVYTFLSNKLPFYNKCEFILDVQNSKVKRCTFYFMETTYYEKTEMLYEKMDYDVKFPLALFDINKYIDKKKKIGKGVYKNFKLIEE